MGILNIVYDSVGCCTVYRSKSNRELALSRDFTSYHRASQSTLESREMSNIGMACKICANIKICVITDLRNIEQVARTIYETLSYVHIVRTLNTLSIWNNYLLVVMLRAKPSVSNFSLTMLRLDAPKRRCCVCICVFVFLGKVH